MSSSYLISTKYWPEKEFDEKDARPKTHRWTRFTANKQLQYSKTHPCGRDKDTVEGISLVGQKLVQDESSIFVFSFPKKLRKVYGF